jgi:hypothetical protein
MVDHHREPGLVEHVFLAQLGEIFYYQGRCTVLPEAEINARYGYIPRLDIPSRVV